MLDHLITILRVIPPYPSKVSSTDLYEYMQREGMGVNRRQFQRYMELLCSKYPIEVNLTTKPHEYQWKPNAQGLSLRQLSPNEALLLQLAEQQLGLLLPESLKASMKPFFEQARKNLHNKHILSAPGAPDREAREWLDKVRVISTSVPIRPPQVAKGVLETVSECLLHNRMINVVYKNAKGEVKDKRIKPLGLALADVRMFLVCTFDGYEDTRNLVLHRIQSAQDTGMLFERPTGFNLATYDADGQFASGQGQRVPLSMWISPYLALLMEETPLSDDQTLTPMAEPQPWKGSEPRQGAHLQATVVDSDDLVRWLRSQGKGLRLLGPDSLIARM